MGGMKYVNEDSRFSKVASMEAHNVNNNVLTQRLPMIFERLQSTIFHFDKFL